MHVSRRTLLLASASAPLALSGCATVKAIFSSTDYIGEATSLFTAGNVALTALAVLVKTGVIPKAKAQGWSVYVNAVAAQFATLHGDIDGGASLGQAAIDQAATALNALQTASAPAAAIVTPAQAARALAAHRHAFAITVAAVVTWVLANLDTLISAGGAIAALIQELVTEIRNISAGSTTVAQADTAYEGWAAALAGWNAAVA